MRKCGVVLLAAVAAAGPALADCVAESATLRPHLLELYSSEGCSSCPPAERWLRGVQTSADVVPLEFHVDYWDQLGWRDRFDDPRYTARQQSIAVRQGGTSIYTPQVVLDGNSWAGWYRGGSLPKAAAAVVSLQLHVQLGAPLHVRVAAHADAGLDPTKPVSPASSAALQTYIALVEDALVSEVRAGENNGATLRHDHVVRAFAGPLPLAAAQVDLSVPQDVDLTHASVVAFLQNPDDGTVAQVVSLPLSKCR